MTPECIAPRTLLCDEDGRRYTYAKGMKLKFRPGVVEPELQDWIDAQADWQATWGRSEDRLGLPAMSAVRGRIDAG